MDPVEEIRQIRLVVERVHEQVFEIVNEFTRNFMVNNEEANIVPEIIAEPEIIADPGIVREHESIREVRLAAEQSIGLVLAQANARIRDLVVNNERVHFVQGIVADHGIVWQDQNIRRHRPGAWRLPVRRPRKYNEATRNQAIQSVREGVSYRQIARSIGRHCSTSTISKWVYEARAQGLLPPGPTNRRRTDGAQE